MTTAQPWTLVRPPRAILALRLQSLGDIVITLPYLQSLRNMYPDMVLDFAVRSEFFELVASLTLFNKVWEIRGRRSGKRQFIYLLFLIPQFWTRQYEVVIDLQNSKVSRWILRLIGQKAWTSWDSRSHSLAADRTLTAIQRLNLRTVDISTTISTVDKSRVSAIELLKEAGWDKTHRIVVLNPAGAFPTRNWPLRYYPELVRQLRTRIDPLVSFVILGNSSLSKKAKVISEATDGDIIDLTGKTTQSQAFVIVSMAMLTVSEDSAIMHMSWVQGIPTVAILGSTPSYWSAPKGSWTYCFNSSDMPCGNCYAEVCKWGDNRCLSRVSVEQVLNAALMIIGK